MGVLDFVSLALLQERPNGRQCRGSPNRAACNLVVQQGKKQGSLEETQVIPVPIAAPAATQASVTVFVCANCARGGFSPEVRLGRPNTPEIPWRQPVKQIVVPCSGRVQPEHLLRAFEMGADLVCVIACEEDNCHQLEGSCRAARRCAYVGGLLDEIGLGRERLMLMHLPGSARADMETDSGSRVRGPAKDLAEPGTRNPEPDLRRIAEQVAERLRSLPLSPLHTSLEIAEAVDCEIEEAEDNDD